PHPHPEGYRADARAAANQDAPRKRGSPHDPHSHLKSHISHLKSGIRGFGGMLASPDHFRRRTTRLVSYYALFKGMAASKPTSQLARQSHILSHSACTPGP